MKSSLQFGCARVLICLIAWMAVSGCSNPPANPVAIAPGKPRVVATNLPLRYFAERIGGDRIGIDFLVPADEDPAYWLPPAEDVLQMQTADLVLLNGAQYEKWLTTVTLNDARTVDTSSAFAAEFIPMKNVITHSHGPTGEHTHGGLAKTTWIDFQQARVQAQAVAAAFSSRWPEYRDEFAANAQVLDDDLQQLDRAMSAAAQKLGSTPVIVSHPEYDYWARRYQINIESVHWEAGDDLDENALLELGPLLARHPAPYVIWEDDPHELAVAKLEALGLESVVFAPRGNYEGDTDWLTLMRENVANIERIAGLRNGAGQ